MNIIQDSRCNKNNSQNNNNTNFNIDLHWCNFESLATYDDNTQTLYNDDDYDNDDDDSHHAFLVDFFN